MRALITGAAGFLASRLAEALLKHGVDVTGIDNLSTGRRENFPRGGTLIVADIRDAEFMETLGTFDLVYHAAASYADRDDWERDAGTNVSGTINVVRLAQRSHAKLVYFQTSLCYGPRPLSPITVGASLDPHGSYAVSKTAGESYIRDSGLDFVSLRLANIYGPRNLSGPIPTFYKRLKEGKRCTVVDSRRDFVFVDDLVWVAVKAANQGQGIYHVSSGSDYAIRQLYVAVREAMGLPYEDPEVIARGPDDVATLLLDPSQTLREFGWRATTTLADGVARAVAYYEEFGVDKTFTHLAQKG